MCYNNQIKNMKKGFTLIELLVVIAILAILATVIVVVINPAELLKQARDTTRISDVAAINSAIALYIADVVSPDLDASQSVCISSTSLTSTSTAVNCTAAGTSPLGNAVCTANAVTTVAGAGWIPLDFTSISSGSPMSRLPLDPVNSTTYFYAYGCNNTLLTYEIDANMESNKYSNASLNTSVERNAYDGGSNNNWYEIGNSSGLAL